MFCFRGPEVCSAYRQAQARRPFAVRFLSTKIYDPLRVLFCGSDEFSIASLKALHAEHRQRPDRIASIDVVCRPGKMFGKGLNNIREVPIKTAATDLSLPIHEIDTFRGWTPPVLPEGPINLIVAVSFGLFVPRRILTATKYGGLNVHPSMLPDLHGPAPLHHTLLAGRDRTGVTLQSLHPEHFDGGVILQQTPQPGFEIPDPDACTVPQLFELVSTKGAEILVDGIRKGLFVPPVQDVVGSHPTEKPKNLIHATKVTTQDRHIDWKLMSGETIKRRSRVIGPLWNMSLVPPDTRNNKPAYDRRVILTDIKEVSPIGHSEKLAFATEPGRPFLASPTKMGQRKGKKEGIYVWTADQKQLRIDKMKVEGEVDAEAVKASRRAKFLLKNKEPDGSSEDFEFRTWHGSLS